MLLRTSYSAETPKIWFGINHYEKLAAEEGSISEYHLNANELECNINSQAIHALQTQWNDSPMGRFAHEIHPKIGTVSWFKNFNLNRRQIVLQIRLIITVTWHSYTEKYV
jgi:hypothetical protein